MAINRADPLEAFIDESIRLFAKRDYHPSEFVGIQGAIRRGDGGY